jgi:hypothetical protein
MLENADIIYGNSKYFTHHLGYSITIWYILCSFGTFFRILVSCTKKNLATLTADCHLITFVRNELSQRRGNAQFFSISYFE